MPKHRDDDDEHYGRTLYALQIELVKLQRRLIAENERVLVIFEGRDGAGKDGAIKRLTEHMSPRETRIHAPGKPSDREVTQWYFQRFVRYLPSGGEFVVFNRSWYNRAGVESVMGFCTEGRGEEFLRHRRAVRGDSGARGHPSAQILSRHHQEGAEETPCRAQGKPPQALEDFTHRRGGAEKMERLFQGARRNVETHKPRTGALDGRMFR